MIKRNFCHFFLFTNNLTDSSGRHFSCKLSGSSKIFLLLSRLRSMGNVPVPRMPIQNPDDSVMPEFVMGLQLSCEDSLALDVLINLLKPSAGKHCQRSPSPKPTHPQLLSSKTLPKVELTFKESLGPMLCWVDHSRWCQVLKSAKVVCIFFLRDTTLF